MKQGCCFFGLPLTREVDFAKQKTEGEKGFLSVKAKEITQKIFSPSPPMAELPHQREPKTINRNKPLNPAACACLHPTLNSGLSI